jgi:cell division protein FtsW
MLLWMIPLLLSGMGAVMITSSTSGESFAASGTPYAIGLRQGQWLFLAILAMIGGYSVRTESWQRGSGALWALGLLLTWITLVPGIGDTAGGARRWIRIPGFSIQSGEFLCLAASIHLTKIICRERMDAVRAFTKILAIVFISGLPLILQPDLGTTVLIYLIGMGLYVERFGWKLPVAFTLGSSCLVFVPLVLLTPYRLRRVLAFLDPWQDPLDTGFQAIQGLIAFANGGLWGTGLGHGFQKLNYLPAAYTDFIYAALGEELGLIGTGCLLILFAIWVTRTHVLYLASEDDFARPLTWALVLTVLLPLFINVAGVTKLAPMKGMPLPFVSYGGSSLLMMWLRIGILLRLSRSAGGNFNGEEGWR